MRRPFYSVLYSVPERQEERDYPWRERPGGVSHVYRRQRPAPLPSCTAKSGHQPQLGVDGLQVAHGGERSGWVTARKSPWAAR
jgi:hypothetical protein